MLSPNLSTNVLTILERFSKILSSLHSHPWALGGVWALGRVANMLRYKPVTVTFSCRFTEDECEEMFRLANADDDGNFNYLDFVKTIKHGAKDD